MTPPPRMRRLVASLLLLAAIVALAGGCGGKPSSKPATRRATWTPAKPKPAKLAPLALEPPPYDRYEPLPVLTYHVVDPTSKNQFAVRPQEFEAQLAYLRDSGFSPITARQLAGHVATGTPLPAKPVMITFDDGWLNQYTQAAPLLAKYGFKAVFFLNPQKIGHGKAYMTRDMVAALASAGHEIESHTWWHMSLVRPPGETLDVFGPKVDTQLTLAAHWIEELTGVAPIAMAYPYGNYDLEAAQRLDKAGYRLALTTEEGIADARPWDRLALKRLQIAGREKLETFAKRLNSAPLAARDITPPPGSHVATNTLTLSADITAVPAAVTGIHYSAGKAAGETTILTRNGRRYATVTLTGAKTGSRAVLLSGHDPSGRRYIASWTIQIGF